MTKRTRVAKRAKAIKPVKFKDLWRSDVLFQTAFTPNRCLIMCNQDIDHRPLYLTRAMARKLARALMRFCEGE